MRLNIAEASITRWAASARGKLPHQAQ